MDVPWRVSLSYYYSKNSALQVEIESQSYGGELKTFPYFDLLFFFRKGNFTPYMGIGSGIMGFFGFYPLLAPRGGVGLKYNFNPWLNIDIGAYYHYFESHISLKIGLEVRETKE